MNAMTLFEEPMAFGVSWKGIIDSAGGEQLPDLAPGEAGRGVPKDVAQRP